MEELRSAWAKMCNELYEEKGLTERVDARSYEERGIDKIPMVHEGPNVQAMEARGISTALGSLNRLIRANYSGLFKKLLLEEKCSRRFLRLWNTKGEEFKSETICRDDPLSGRAGCENPRTADRENPGIRYTAE